MAEALTPENFIFQIKQMDTRGRGKLTAVKLLELILAKADLEDDRLHELDHKISDLFVKYEESKQSIFRNSVDIRSVREAIPAVIQGANNNNNNNNNINNINNNEAIVAINKKLHEMQGQIFEMDQYLRVNNIEVVGLPLPENDENGAPAETHEEILIEALNSLNEFHGQITGEDIDICHPIPSRRKDKKDVMICRFVSRKAKIAILDAKRKQKDFQFKNKTIYINEHLSPDNRRIFSEASAVRRTKQYKHIWTANGVTHMRKEDGTPAIKIGNSIDLTKL